MNAIPKPASSTGHLPAPRVHVRSNIGWPLNILDFEPRGPSLATVVAGHAMMVDRRTLCRDDRPTVVSILVDAGFRVLVPDLRGHGESGPLAAQGGRWSYDDLVADTAVYRHLCRELTPDEPTVFLGHSLFGHTSMAYFGDHPGDLPDAMVLLSVALWSKQCSTNCLRRLAQVATMQICRGAIQVAGYLPARRFRMGSHDEAANYFLSLARWTVENHWSSDFGVDYSAQLANISAPVLHVVSESDRFMAPADEALRFTANLPLRELVRLGQNCRIPELRGVSPGHMELVTDPSSAPVWGQVKEWLKRVLNVG